MQKAASDQIELIEFIQMLWNRKWVITAITAAFAIFSIGVVLQIRPIFEGNLRITSLSNQEMPLYQAQNKTPDISEPIYAGEMLVDHTGVVSREGFSSAFKEEVLQKLIFRAA